MKNVSERFLKYVKFHTTSDNSNESSPSSPIQLTFANELAADCKAIGLSGVSVDEHGYLYAELPGNISGVVPAIGFIAHMDTSPDAFGKNVNPQIIENYDGGDILLNTIRLSPNEFPELLDYKGQTLITTDGKTLLGADDKAGIAEILTAMEYLIANPQISHGTIKIAFTPDEEIGRGADLFDVKKFGASFAYTIDGGKIGELEFENFNAARAKIEIEGKSVHPGTAKNKMVNALHIAMEIAASLPIGETPANTENYEGFFHLHALNGHVGHASLSCLIRDFDEASFVSRKELLKQIVLEKNNQYANCIKLSVYDEYYNMASKIQPRMEIVELAKAAMLRQGVKPVVQPIRGGTDGARLSYMGLPCPNIFTGGHNFHGPFEFIPIPSMEKAVEVIAAIAEMAAKK